MTTALVHCIFLARTEGQAASREGPLRTLRTFRKARGKGKAMETVYLPSAGEGRNGGTEVASIPSDLTARR
jgi:hypothetical protein